MVVSYPASDFSWTNRVDGVDDVMASDPNTLAGEINAIEADLVGTGVAGGLATTAYASLSARLAIDVNQIIPQVVNLKIVKHDDEANVIDIFAKSSGALPGTATPIKVMIPDGNGAQLRTRSAQYLSGTSKITLADAGGYWGRASADGSSYDAYLYAIWDGTGIVWALGSHSDMTVVSTTTTATDADYLLLETSSTYTRSASHYCVCVGKVSYQYDTGDAPDHTLSAVMYVRYGNNSAGSNVCEYNGSLGSIKVQGSDISAYSVVSSTVAQAGTYVVIGKIVGGCSGGATTVNSQIKTGSATYGSATTRATGTVQIATASYRAEATAFWVGDLSAGDTIHLGGEVSGASGDRYIYADQAGQTALLFFRVA